MFPFGGIFAPKKPVLLIGSQNIVQNTTDPAFAGYRLNNNGVAEEQGPNIGDFTAILMNSWIDTSGLWDIDNYEWWCDLVSSTTVVEGSATDSTWRFFSDTPSPNWYIQADAGNDVENAQLTVMVRDSRYPLSTTVSGTIDLEAEGV